MHKVLWASVPALLLVACGGGSEEPLDPPAEAEIVGGEKSWQDAKANAETKEEYLAADEAATAASKEAKSEVATVGQAIPEKYHGKWDAPGSDCAEFEYSESRTQISANEIRYVESYVEVAKVQTEGKDVIAEGKMFEPGDGPTPAVIERLTLMTTPQGVRLQISDGTKPKGGDVYELSRCE